MVQIGHTEDDPIPLCLQENDIHLWKEFATISQHDFPSLFEDYTDTGTPNGT